MPCYHKHPESIQNVVKEYSKCNLSENNYFNSSKTTQYKWSFPYSACNKNIEQLVGAQQQALFDRALLNEGIALITLNF